ncbi:MAG TPA: NEL-type E3 ubiquitin ligase domain-containing protein [Pseudomonas sp.]|nr:NEL-type E3 ubiquitin ligase domain-containing protein [Pseudomonas sp.]
MSQATTTTLGNATDQFVASRLPHWLKQASQGQINKLRDCYAAHRASHEKLAKALRGLASPQAFARQAFTGLLGAEAASLGFEELEWLEVRRRLTVSPGIVLPQDEISYVRSPALLRMMQNFSGGEPFYEGSGLVAKGESTPLSGDANVLSRRCRELDAGQQYQALLSKTVTAQVREALADHKRTGFNLALELAALKGEIGGLEQAAVRAVVSHDHTQKLTRAYAGTLKMLGCVAFDALLIQLRESEGEDAGVVLYMPADTQHPLRHFTDLASLNDALAADLVTPAVHQRIGELVKLSERTAFVSKLDKRLSDSEADLGLEGQTVKGDVFAALAEAHVKRLCADASMLLVPTAEADKSDAEHRLSRWKGIAMGALGVAGLFVPGLGELLLAQLALQVTKQTYDGVADWAQGHQHEAAEHLLGVAEIVAVTAATAAGAGLLARGFSRSAFVDQLEPVDVDGKMRLWAHDLSRYEADPGQVSLQDDGLYGEGERRFLRIESRYYPVHRPEQYGPWRLKHPAGSGVFEPELIGNGERCWRLRLERPLEWDDSTQMLDRLWPSDPPLQAQQVERMLQVSGVDQDELRGLLVENRPLPVNLRDTLCRFQADARLTRLFERLQQSPEVFPDVDVLDWCKKQPGLQRLSDAQIGSALLEDLRLWRGRLLEHLAAPVLADDAVMTLLKRDFPGLPDAYAQEALRDLAPAARELARLEQRVPLTLAKKARSLLQLARANRALEGLYLQGAYSDATGELVFALLRNLPKWPGRLKLELRQGTESGRLLAQLDPQASAASRTVLVYREGGFRLYDAQGLELDVDVAEPASIFDALLALLSPTERTDLGLGQDHAVLQLRDQLAAGLPAQRKRLFNLLGWRDQTPWFNPGSRLPDGRVGYTLGGRVPTREYSTRTLRDRIRALYPGFSEAQVESFFQRLLQEPGSPFDHLIEHERNYAQLDQALNRWGSTTDRALRNQQHHFAEQLRRAWRLEGEVEVGEAGSHGTMRVNLSGWHINRLPSLPAEVDFSHVGELVLAGMGLEEVPANFLRCFDRVHTLVLTNNRLTAIPSGLSHLRELRSLRLMANRIHMSSRNQDVLSSLARLEVLDISHNPLRSLSLRFEERSRLQSLRLGHCRLRTIPNGIEQCGLLQFADLSDNQIEVVPAELLRMPWSFRARLNLARNPISAAERERLYGLDRHGAAARLPEASEDLMARWLGDQSQVGRQARMAVWQRVQRAEGSAGLFELLQALTQGSDFSRERGYVSDQVWNLLEAIDQNPSMRGQIFDSAGETLGCVDSTAERFSRLQIQALAYQAGQRSTVAEAGTELLDLGRRLFRLEALDRFAFLAVDQRRLGGELVDDLEIVLGYRIHLAEALDLPCQPRTMTFNTLADITEERRKQALQAVLAAQTPEAVAQSVSRQRFWTDYLRAQHPQPFTAIGADFDARGEALDAQAEQLTTEVYVSNWGVLKAERESAEHELCLLLTREALARPRQGS